VDDVFEQPVLRLGGDDLPQSAIRAMYEDTPQAAYFGGDGNGDFDLIRIIFGHRKFGFRCCNPAN
jgi:hypothetical protein